MKTYEGNLVSRGIKVGIVAARFNEFIVSKLISGATDGLVRHDVREEDIEIAWVPGAFEIPLIASKMAKSEPITLALGQFRAFMQFKPQAKVYFGGQQRSHERIFLFTI